MDDYFFVDDLQAQQILSHLVIVRVEVKGHHMDPPVELLCQKLRPCQQVSGQSPPFGLHRIDHLIDFQICTSSYDLNIIYLKKLKHPLLLLFV